MASASNYLWPQEGLDYLMGVVPKAGTTPTTLYVGLFTTSWSTVQGYGLTNINVTLNGGTYPVTELASATGYTSRPDRKSTRLNSSHIPLSRMPSSA